MLLRWVDLKIIENEDKELVKEIKENLAENSGYCPCRTNKTEDTKCMCLEFREHIKDKNWFGECHCGLYVKTE